MRPTPPVDREAYTLNSVDETPTHLGEALKLLAEANQLDLPTSILKTYAGLKEKEWREYLAKCGSWSETWNKITSWEYEKYL